MGTEQSRFLSGMENGPFGWLVGAQEANLRCTTYGFLALTRMEQPLPSLLFVVKSHKRFTRYKGSGAVPYQRSPFERPQELCTQSPDSMGFLFRMDLLHFLGGFSLANGIPRCYIE